MGWMGKMRNIVFIIMFKTFKRSPYQTTQDSCIITELAKWGLKNIDNITLYLSNFVFNHHEWRTLAYMRRSCLLDFLALPYYKVSTQIYLSFRKSQLTRCDCDLEVGAISYEKDLNQISKNEHCFVNTVRYGADNCR